ncbi:hypothetical protein LTR36_010532 [Oleoguttula mirabilis]|uniref:NAD(P)-binding protein n=1 Tax=Oleoguttula mirabilis TaxID=1507867 RepID=A0AAV9J3Y8_9PEZI|nr:hypothetical protein LTR36_010532 [Oleoguttula mirabilis]
MPPKLDLDWKEYGPFSFAVSYGQKAYNTWVSDTVQLAAAVLGTAVVFSLLASMVLSCAAYIRPAKLQVYCHSETGSWALVTGASDGIGRAFVDELLERGFNVLLHGRNQEKLERIMKELAQQHPKRSIDFVVADASRPDHPEDIVAAKVKQLPGKLTILVNNVGGITSKPQYVTIDKVAAEHIDAQLNINARFPTQLIRALLPTLQESQPSIILNCGSAGALVGIPYIATYTATKAYVHTLTMALKAEMLAEGLAPDKKFTKGVEVQCYIIGNTLSAQNTTDIPYLTQDARACARGCLAKVGSGKTLEYPSWRVAVSSGFMKILPEGLLMKAMVGQMRERKAESEKEE